jgi:hypothetical protein
MDYVPFVEWMRALKAEECPLQAERKWDEACEASK